MKTINFIIKFFSENPIVGVSVVLFFVYTTIKNVEKRLHESQDIRKSFTSRTYGTVEEVLQYIINTVYNRLITKFNEHQPDSVEQAADFHQQRILFKLLLRDVFLFDIKNLIRDAINQSGFHLFDESELDYYCRSKGRVLHEYVLLELRTRAELAIPDILPHIGNNFSEEESVECFRRVVNASLKNDMLRDSEVGKLKSKYSVFGNFKKYFDFLRRR
jgi:hypothetical protein